MKITHNLNSTAVSKDTAENTCFILTNKAGGFTSFGINSRYSGFFTSINGKLLKIIDEIVIDGKITEVTNNFWNVERKRDTGIIERFLMPVHTDTMIYELSQPCHLSLLLDVKEPYDNREWGRLYDVFVENNMIIIKFTKKQDTKDGDSGQNNEYSIYLAIEGDEDLHYKKISEWPKKFYDYDKSRGSFPYERHVFNAMKLFARKLVFSVSESRENAIKNAKSIEKDYHFHNIKTIKASQEINIAFNCARNSLDSLVVNDKEPAIYAGLPWFFQFWTRDEAISLGALIIENGFPSVKKILFKQLNNLKPDGRLPSIMTLPETSSADSIGWHFKRWHDLIEALSAKNLINKSFSKTEMEVLILNLKKSLDAIVMHYGRTGFVSNIEKETWMDSISRGGFRIEIQALYAVMCDTLCKLTGDKFYLQMEVAVKKHILSKFWNGKILSDGLGDSTIRPNIFIAAYVYPDLLSQKEWETCIDNSLSWLWLNFGGFSTIDTRSELFQRNHTGENPTSYHNGDSWFWINNLAALVMHRINKKKYKDKISKIIDASAKEILWKGAIGHHAELSSASELKSEGCLAQAWSSAMFVELINEIYEKCQKKL